LCATPAAAKASYDSPYSYDQTFGSALRLLKVDLDLEVTETNSDWGYLLFVYTTPESGKAKQRGSFSFVRVGEQVQVTLQLPELPSYHEQHVLAKLRQKLEEEHGTPPRPKKKAPPKRDDDKEDGDKKREKKRERQDGDKRRDDDRGDERRKRRD
jgi:hypothetical protein